MAASTVICIHGVVADVVTESIDMKDCTTRQLTTVTIADGPPHAFLRIQFWNLRHSVVEIFENLKHTSVNVTHVHCYVDAQRGNRYESIGNSTRIARSKDTPLETWWLKPEDDADSIVAET